MPDPTGKRLRTLALDTSSRRASVALWDGERTVAHGENNDPSKHAEALVGLIDRLLSDAGWAKSQIDLVACGTGPGSFTGVRVGLATAKGIALALDRPLVGVSSLAAMAGALFAEAGAFASNDNPPDLLVPLLDARKGEIFWAAFDRNLSVVVPPSHAARAALAAQLTAKGSRDRVLVLGEVSDDQDLGIEAFSRRRHPASDLPWAPAVAVLAGRRYAAQGADDIDALEPTYVRPPDARPQDARPAVVLGSPRHG